MDASISRSRQLVLPTFSALTSLAVFGFSANVVPAILNRAAIDFRIEPERLANVTASQFAGFIIATVVGGIVADRLGKKRVFLAACLFTAIGAGCCSAAPALSLILLGAFVMGMGGGILESMSSALLSDLYPLHRKLMLNLSQVAYCAGAVSGPFLIGGLLPSGVSWRWFFVLLLLLAAVLLASYAFSAIPTPRGDEIITASAFKTIVRRWSFIAPCLIIFFYVFSETSVAVFMNVYLFKHMDAPENWAIYCISIFWLSMTLGRIGCALIPESVSYEKVTAVLMFASGLVVGAQAFVSDWRLSVGFFALSGLIFSGVWPLIVGMTASKNPGFSGTVVGLTVAFGAVGCVVAPPVVGSLLLHFPNGITFAFLAVPLFAGSLLLLTIPKEPMDFQGN